MDSRRLHDEAMVVDLHTHGPGFVPEPFGSAYRLVTPRKPKDTGFEILAPAGVDLAVGKAVGDPVVTRWHLRKSPWEAVEAQLSLIEQQAASAGAVMVGSLAALRDARAAGRAAVVLGVEGADAVGSDVDRVDAWAERGVRVVVPVHLGDNQLGRTCMLWNEYAKPLRVLPARHKVDPGLSPLGKQVVRRMQERGILVDAAHADRATLLDMVDQAEAPIVSSHTGARAVQDFGRYLTDDELRAIASTGGLVGLWPYRSGKHGTATVADLMAHARHVADTIGVEHLGIGTDMNGVPGVMAGYRCESDLPVVTRALLDTGFSESEVRAILGANAMRVFAAAWKEPTPPTRGR